MKEETIALAKETDLILWPKSAQLELNDVQALFYSQWSPFYSRQKKKKRGPIGVEQSLDKNDDKVLKR